MKSLIIYDDAGALVMPCFGSYTKPQGNLHYMEVEVPAGKMVTRVDVTTDSENHQPVLVDLPISNEQKQILDLQKTVVDMQIKLNGGI